MPETPAPPVPAPAAPPFDVAKDVADHKLLAAAGYLWAASVVLYVWKKDSPFVRFHARQGVVLFLLSIIAYVLPFVGRPLQLLTLVVMAVGFYNAYQGTWRELPIIGALARGNRADARKEWKDLANVVRGEQKKPDPASPPPPPPPPSSSHPA